jgi:autotransporter-associated beta strand protein
MAVSAAILSIITGSREVSAQSFTYAGPVTYVTPGTSFTPQSWSVTTWSGGTPTSSTATTLNFSNYDNYGYTTQNDLGAPFTLNRINVTNYGVYPVTVSNYGPPSPGTIQTLRFDGTNPTVNIIGTGGLVLGGITGGRSGTSLSLAQNLTITGTGTGLVTLMGTTTYIGGAGALVINRSSEFGIVTVFGNFNSNTGGIVLNQGTFQFGSSNSTGNGPLTINGGIVGTSGIVNMPRNIIANSNFVFGGGSLTVQGTVSGSGGLVVRNGDNYISQSLTLSGANTYSGPTTITGAKPGYNSLNPRGGLTIAATGSISSVQPITIGSASSLTLQGWSTSNRIPDTAPIYLDNGQIIQSSTLSGSLTFIETFGPLQTSGTAVITALPSALTSFQFGALTRVNKSTLFVRGMLRGTTDNNVTVTFAGGVSGAISDPTGPTGGVGTAVIPWITGSSNPTSLAPARAVVYDPAGGLRFLSPTDSTYFVQLDQGDTFGPSTQGANVNLKVTMTTVAVTGSNRVNSLAVASSKLISGDGVLTVYSGATYFNGGITRFTSSTLDFGNNTGYIHLGSLDSLGSVAYVGFEGTSTITGSNGVVVSTPSTNSLNLDLRLQLSNDSNAFTGGLFVNGGATVAFTKNEQLGAAGQPITLDGGTLSLNPATPINLQINRPLTLGRAGGTMYGGGGLPNTITYTGVISGPGSLGIGNGFAALGPVVLTAANNYAGDTVVNGAVLAISSQQNLGQGDLILNNGLLRTDNFFTLTKNIALWGSSNAIDTNGNDVVVAGPITTRVSAGNVFTKTGFGDLSLSVPSPDFSGTIYVNKGSFTLTSAAKLPNIAGTGVGYVVDGNGVTNAVNRGGIAIEATAKFILDNSVTNLSDRISPGVRVTMNPDAEFRLVGADNASTTQTLGGFSLVATGYSTINVVNGNNGTASLVSTQPLAGPGSIFKDGDGSLEIQKVSSTFTGNVFVSQGQVVVKDPLRIPGSGVTTFYSSATLTLAATGSTSYPAAIVGEFASATARNYSTIAVAPGNGTRKVTIVSAIDLSSDGVTIDGNIDLADTDMIVRGGDINAIRQLVKSWWNGGSRDGAGIKSSLSGGPGNAAYTTLAVFNNNYNGLAYFPTFDGITVGPNDVLIKYTYFGDTNLDGVLDGRDVKYAMEGLVNQQTGWLAGDFDYDGQVTSADIGKLFQYRNLNLPALPNSGASAGSGEITAIPEPQALALIPLTAALATRRRRK